MRRFNEEEGDWICTHCRAVWDGTSVACPECNTPSGVPNEEYKPFKEALKDSTDMLYSHWRDMSNVDPIMQRILSNQIAIMKHLQGDK